MKQRKCSEILIDVNVNTPSGRKMELETQSTTHRSTGDSQHLAPFKNAHIRTRVGRVFSSLDDSNRIRPERKVASNCYCSILRSLESRESGSETNPSLICRDIRRREPYDLLYCMLRLPSLHTILLVDLSEWSTHDDTRDGRLDDAADGWLVEGSASWRLRGSITGKTLHSHC